MKAYDIYISLLEQFLYRNMPVKEFVLRYLSMFSKEDAAMSDALFPPLDMLCAEVNAYTDDPVLFLESPGSYIDENQLRQVVIRTLEEIRPLIRLGN